MKRKCLAACFLICVFLLEACGGRRYIGDDEPRIYYVNAEGTRLIKETFDFDGASKEDKIAGTLEALQEETDSVDYKSPFPEGISVESWELHDTTLNLYFDGAYSELKSSEELLLRAAVVQTLVQISDVEYVRFFVQGVPLTDHKGQDMGYMRAEDFVQNVGSSLHTYQAGNFKLYFANEKGDRLLEENVSVRYNSNMSKEKLIVEKLVKGPSGDGFYPVIAPETEILGVSVRDRICYVNFDDGFLNTAYKIDPNLTVYALVNSIAENHTVDQVQILVNGESDVTYQGSVDLSKPFSPDYHYVEEEKD